MVKNCGWTLFRNVKKKRFFLEKFTAKLINYLCKECMNQQIGKFARTSRILVSVIEHSTRSCRRPCFVILPTDDVLSQPPNRPRSSSSLKVILSKARQTDKFSLIVLYHFYSLIQLAGLKTKEVFSALESNRIGSSRRGQWMDSGIRAANKTCDLYGCYCGSVTVLWQSRPVRARRACA